MATAKRGGLWGWVHDVGKSCGFAQQPLPPPMWVRANPELFPQEVPGMGEELLAAASQAGGSLEEKIQEVVDTFRCSARHLESLQQVLRKRALERREKQGEPQLPAEVEQVISEGTYLDSFLEAYDGKNFELYSEEIVPCHCYRLALEVHSGGAYWSSIPVQEAGAVRHKVETVSASSSHEGSASIVSQFGAAQRGAVFVWRWQHLLDQGPYNIPEWLSRALATDGNDPLRKLMSELEAIRRWEQQVKHDACSYVKQSSEVKDPYIREVLRLWPDQPDGQGGEQLKKCAWVEGLDSRLFVGRQVLVQRVQYDGSHALTLHALISKRHTEETGPPESNPPYRLTTTWQWASASTPGTATGRAVSTFAGAPVPASAAGASAPPSTRRSQDGLAGTANSLASSQCLEASPPPPSSSRPGTAASLAPSELTRPGTAFSEGTRPGTFPEVLRVPPNAGSAAALALPGGSCSAAAAPAAPQAVSFAAQSASAAYASAGYLSAAAPLPLPVPVPIH